MKNKRNITESYKLSKIAKEVIAGGVCHDVRFADPHPIYIERSYGPHIWDIDNNKYIDYGMGNGSLLIGHSHPDVIKACLLYTSPSPRDGLLSRMPSSA